MDYQNQVKEFLLKKENLSIALEVSKQIGTLRPQLHQSFWREVGEEMRNRIIGSEYEGRWFLLSRGEYNSKSKNHQYRVKSIPEGYTGCVLSLCFYEWENDQLSFGVVWQEKERPAPELDAYKKLLRVGRPAGFLEKEYNSWWPTWCYLGIYPQSDEFMLDYGTQPKEFVTELVDKIWNYFISIEPLLYEVNEALLKE